MVTIFIVTLNHLGRETELMETHEPSSFPRPGQKKPKQHHSLLQRHALPKKCWCVFFFSVGCNKLILLSSQKGGVGLRWFFDCVTKVYYTRGFDSRLATLPKNLDLLKMLGTANKHLKQIQENKQRIRPVFSGRWPQQERQTSPKKPRFFRGF